MGSAEVGRAVQGRASTRRAPRPPLWTGQWKQKKGLGALEALRLEVESSRAHRASQPTTEGVSAEKRSTSAWIRRFSLHMKGWTQKGAADVPTRCRLSTTITRQAIHALQAIVRVGPANRCARFEGSAG
jgi:hypothetical protein